ncbi:hypothetical protein ABPG72_004113 [Tetrahymena utriculariae]
MDRNDDEMNLDDNSNNNQYKDDDENYVKSENEIKITKDIILVHIEKTQKKITELIPDYDISQFLNSNNEIILGDLISSLKETGFPIDQNMVHYWCPEAEMFIYCGFDPLPEDITIPLEDYSNYNEIKIKCKENPISLIHQIMSEETNEMNNNKQKDGNVQEKKEAKNNCRRTKERKIGFIIEKVVQWRNYYNGVPDASGKSNRLSLEEAANKVQISKKSLDDYLLQIRFGRKYQFNFNEHKNDKVGILRAFVKKHKQQQNQDKPKKRKEKKGDANGIQSKKEEEEKN